MKTYNWGIIGPGHIAHKFAQDLLLFKHAKLYAVASRSLEKAKEFAGKYNAEKYYASYKELANDNNVDIVYIATPHVYHCEHTIMCLEAGKHVLCEKPFSMNAEEVKLMIGKAREKNLFLMDAFWMRFIPATKKILKMINKGMIGTVKIVKSDFGFGADYLPNKRLFNKALGGGSLLDIGIYPVFLSQLLLGLPDDIKATAVMSDTGVDASFAAVLKYKTGQLSLCDSTFLADTATEAWIYGDKGALKLHGPFHHTDKISHYVGNTLQQIYEVKYRGNGYCHEIQEVSKCLEAGMTESEKLPLSFTADLISTLDRIRAEIGLEY